MRKFCLGVILIALAMNLSAQKISNKVIPSGGGILTSNAHQISFTIGETLIPTLSASGFMITQGFQQPGDAIDLSLQNPASLESLNASIDRGTAKLKWETNSTAKTGSYILERLNNESGIYETIDTRPINSLKTTLTEYDFSDSDPQDGDNFYRIKQSVPKQVARISEVRKLNFSAVEIVTVFPNPTVNEVNLDLSAYLGRGASISIFNYGGQLMLQQKIVEIGNQPIKILLDRIETGQYQIRIKVNDKRSLIVKPLMISK